MANLTVDDHMTALDTALQALPQHEYHSVKVRLESLRLAVGEQQGLHGVQQELLESEIADLNAQSAAKDDAIGRLAETTPNSERRSSKDSTSGPPSASAAGLEATIAI